MNDKYFEMCDATAETIANLPEQADDVSAVLAIEFIDRACAAYAADLTDELARLLDDAIFAIIDLRVAMYRAGE